MNEYKEYVVVTSTKVEARDLRDAIQTAIEVQSPYNVSAYEVSDKMMAEADLQDRIDVLLTMFETVKDHVHNPVVREQIEEVLADE